MATRRRDNSWQVSGKPSLQIDPQASSRPQVAMYYEPREVEVVGSVQERYEAARAAGLSYGFTGTETVEDLQWLLNSDDRATRRKARSRLKLMGVE